MSSEKVETIWHPYSSVTNPSPTLKVVGASGTRLHLESGQKLIDAMSSWWSVIHGYNHPELNRAAGKQLNTLSHVMFGGLTHEPAERLCAALLDIAPDNLHSVFLSDTGSVSVEVAMKMAAQYWHGKGLPNKSHFICLRGGYHGDTRAAMSVSDPETGMHQLFTGIIQTQRFLERPPAGFDRKPSPQELMEMDSAIAALAKDSAALIVEPIVQGAGGMYFYSPDYLKALRQCCDKYQLLMIADEIATGFGRTGKLFACEHASIAPDILCVGKAMTGGYLTQAATLCSEEVARGICSSEAGVFMHGPTFMANPLACSLSLASLDILANNEWRAQIQNIQTSLQSGLETYRDHENVEDIRVLGAIGVIETKNPIDNAKIIPTLLSQGVWLRPFGKLLYTMPPYITSAGEIESICSAMGAILDLG